MHVKHQERPQATRHDLSNLRKATTKSNYQLHQRSTTEKWMGKRDTQKMKRMLKMPYARRDYLPRRADAPLQTTSHR